MSTWILLRGLGREAAHWGDFPGRFAQALGAEAIPLDLPGTGRHYRERSPATMAGIVGHLRAALAREGRLPPYRLAALSLGGMVAMQWMADHPGEIERAVLMSTSARGAGRLHERLSPRAWPVLAAALAGAPGRAVEQRILALTSVEPARHAGVVDDWLAIRAARPVSRANLLRQLAAAARFHLPAAPGVPVLVLTGARDALVSPACSLRLAGRWPAIESELHPAAGHDLPLDQPDWVIARVRQWCG